MSGASVANRVWKAAFCSLVAAYCGGCGRVAASAGDTGDPSAGAGATGGASTAAAGAGGTATPPRLVTSWTPCQTLTAERASRMPHALAASTDLRWVAVLDTPSHYPDDPAFDDSANSSAYQSVALWHLPATSIALRLTNVSYGFNLALSPDGTLVAISGDGVDVTNNEGTGARALSDGPFVWRSLPPDVPIGGSFVRSLAFSPDSTLLASGRNYDVDLFRADIGTPVDKLVTQVSSPGVAFSPNGKHLASSAPASWRVADRTAEWAPPASDPLAKCDFDCFSDNWVTFSPDGALLLTQFAHLSESFAWDTTTTLVDAASGNVLQSFGAGLPRRPTFSPDGHWIVAGDRLIDAKTGEQSPLGVEALLSLFLSDGRILAASASGAVTLLCPRPA